MKNQPTLKMTKAALLRYVSTLHAECEQLHVECDGLREKLAHIPPNIGNATNQIEVLVRQRDAALAKVEQQDLRSAEDLCEAVRQRDVALSKLRLIGTVLQVQVGNAGKQQPKAGTRRAP